MDYIRKRERISWKFCVFLPLFGIAYLANKNCQFDPNRIEQLCFATKIFDKFLIDDDQKLYKNGTKRDAIWRKESRMRNLDCYFQIFSFTTSFVISKTGNVTQRNAR